MDKKKPVKVTSEELAELTADFKARGNKIVRSKASSALIVTVLEKDKNAGNSVGTYFFVDCPERGQTMGITAAKEWSEKMHVGSTYEVQIEASNRIKTNKKKKIVYRVTAVPVLISAPSESSEPTTPHP